MSVKNFKFKLRSQGWPFRFRSLNFEISVIYTVVLAVILLVFSGMIYRILSQTLYAELDTEVRLKAQEISSSIRNYVDVKGADQDSLRFALEKTIASTEAPQRRWWYVGFERSWFERLDEQNLRDDYLNVLNAKGKSILRSKNIDQEFLNRMVENGHLSSGQEARMFFVHHGGQQVRVINHPMTLDDKTYTLQVGVSVKPVVQLLRNWMNTVFLSIPIFLFLASFVGRVLASRILKPVDKISETAKTISTEDLSKRVEKEDTYRELDTLRESFNDMIDRLEKSFSHIQNFSSHIAHELKTPLTIMRGETELALHGSRTSKEYKDALLIVLGEIQTMLKVIEDLLFITKTTQQPGAFRFERIDFGSYFKDIHEQGKLLASEKCIKVDLGASLNGKVFVQGDPIHLRRLFFNILDNAIKYSPEQSRIKIDLEKKNHSLTVAIRDRGVGIPEQEMDRIFERFYTVDQHKFGCGLGLSIAQSIVSAHRGHIEAQSRPGEGSTFTVILPTA